MELCTSIVSMVLGFFLHIHTCSLRGVRVCHDLLYQNVPLHSVCVIIVGSCNVQFVRNL